VALLPNWGGYKQRRLRIYSWVLSLRGSISRNSTHIRWVNRAVHHKGGILRL